MAQTSRSTDIKATRAMRDATNSVAPRDIAPKPPAEGKENDKDDGFFFADPAGLTTPAPALPAKTMDPSPTSVLMGPGTPDEAAEQRPRDATPEKATDDGDDAEMTLATSDTSDGESVVDDVASPESPERPATVPERVGSTSPFVPNVLEELLGAQLPRATPPGEPTVRARRESGNLAAPAPQSQTRRATGAQHAASTPPPTSTRWRSVPSPAQIVSAGREWAASGANGPTPGRSSRPLPTFLDDLVAAGRAKVSVDDKGTNTESNESDEHRDRTEDLELECERLKREVDFHRDVSREVGVSLDASAAELERTKRRVEFLESLKDEWDAQFKELSAETERYRAEADAAREETLAAEALAAAARAAATSASAEAESLRKNVDDKNDASSAGEALGELSSGTTSTSASATSTSEVGSAALFRRHRSGAENDVAASIAAALRERESELDQTRLRLDQTLAALNAAEAKLAAKREECAALRGEVNVAKSASAAAREATAQTEGALVTTLEDKKRLVEKIEAMEAKVDAAARDASERVRDATERGRRSVLRARANWGAAALTTAALALCVCAWAAAVPPAGVSFSVPFVHPRDWLAIGGAGLTPRFGAGSAAQTQTIAKPSVVKRVSFTLPGAGYAVAEQLSSCRADLATTASTATRLSLEASRFAGLAKENDRLSNEVKDFARVAESLREREADVTHLESRLAHLESAANDAATRGDDPFAASVAARAETERLRHALAKERTLRRRSASLEKLDVVSIAAVCVAWVTCLLSAWFFASQERGLRRSLNDYGALMEAASAEHERLGSELTSATLDANEERTRRERLECRQRELERQLDASRKAANEATKRVEAFEAIGRREREREREGSRSAERRFGKASSFGGGKSVTWDDDVSIAPSSSTTTTSVVDARAGAQTPEAAARPHNTVFKPPVSFQ